MMQLTAYVNFAGNCRQAFQYYEQHLGGKILMLMTHGQAPGPTNVPADWSDAVLHATLAVAGTEISGSDVPHAEPMRSAYLTLRVTSDSEAERIYAALAEGGQVFQALQETFFASRFAQLRDRFGVNWMILHPRPM